MKVPRTYRPNHILKRQKHARVPLPDFKTYCKAVKVTCCWHEGGLASEQREFRNQLTGMVLISDKGVRAIWWRQDDVFNKQYWNN